MKNYDLIGSKSQVKPVPQHGRGLDTQIPPMDNADRGAMLPQNSPHPTPIHQHVSKANQG